MLALTTVCNQANTASQVNNAQAMHSYLESLSVNTVLMTKRQCFHKRCKNIPEILLTVFGNRKGIRLNRPS